MRFNKVVETDISPCIVQMRLDHASNRPGRNPLPASASEGVYKYNNSIYFENGGDGRARVICPGIEQFGCPGVTVLVDRHDLLQPCMPETSRALGALCVSPQAFYRIGQVLHQYEALDEALAED